MDGDLLTVILMGRTKNNGYFPLMQYLFDGYIRYKLNIFKSCGYGTRLFNCQPEAFLMAYPYSAKLKGKDNVAYNYMFKGLYQYEYGKLFPSIVWKRFVNDHHFMFIKNMKCFCFLLFLVSVCR